MILLHECEQGESTAHSSSSKEKKIILVTFYNTFCIIIGERMWAFIASMQQHIILGTYRHSKMPCPRQNLLDTSLHRPLDRN